MLGHEETVEALLWGEDTPAPDLDGLRHSCMLDLRTWDYVEPAQPPGNRPDGGASSFRWRAAADGVSPLGPEPITTLVDVPAEGAYRIFLRHVAGVVQPRPVKLTITPCRPLADDEAANYVASGDAVAHTFGAFTIGNAETGRELERSRPVRLERETERIAAPSSDLMLWEYWDVNLARGVHRFALSSECPDARAGMLFITQAKAFLPSLAPAEYDRTLHRLYMRVSIENAASRPASYNVSAALTHHWRGRPGKGGPAWGWPIGAASDIAPDAWSPFIEATEAAFPGPGPWSTCHLRFAGIESGTTTVQFAWYPHEEAVLHELRTAIGGSGAMFRMPNGDGAFRTQPDKPAWGIWRRDYLASFKTMEDVLERYLGWAEEEATYIGLEDEHPRCRKLRIMAGNGLGPAYADPAADMLARLGVNRIQGKNAGMHGLLGSGAPLRIARKYALYDETTSTFTRNAAGIAARMSSDERSRHTLHKGGDEISTYVAPETINADPGRLRAFRAYLAEQAAARGMTINQFFGVEDARDLTCIGAPPENAGRFQRRLYYHSHRYCHLASVPGYRSLVERFEKYFPNIRVYNNYSPHPVFLTGSTMNHSDWFVLCRNQAQTMGWAEDWVRRERMSFGFWNVSYYAALVACSARKHGYPSGFYAGLNCGGGARKIFSCVGQGLTWINLYSWGPVDSMAEASNAWSWYRSQYRAALMATHALGPADTIVGEGRREPARTAILYNRSHEIWQGGTGRFNKDWCWSFIALRQGHIPVDVIIEEDLIAKELDRYDVLYLGGFNLDSVHLKNVRAWLEKDENHLLIGSAGALMYDLYNTPMPAATELFGAKQTRAPEDHPKLLKSAAFTASRLYGEQTVNAHGLRFILEPTTGKAIATYDGGDCAAVINTVGKGRALLIGFQPGCVFQGEGGQAAARTWHNEPVLRTLGHQRVELDYHFSEATLFEHADGAAVLLTNFGPASTDVADIREAPPPRKGDLLSVRLDRPVKSVESALRGPLEWQMKDGRVELRTPPMDPVDVVILRW